MQLWGLRHVVGQTITGVIVAEPVKRGNPVCQVFLVFPDKTHIELWSLDIGTMQSSERRRGGLKEIKALNWSGRRIVLEAYLNKKGHLVVRE